MEPEIKRGPGRPRKEVEEYVPGSQPFVKVRIKAYKLRTSQGRGIAGQTMELPPEEAAALIKAGEAVAGV